MIRSETEYQEAVRRLGEEEKRLVEQEAKLREMGLGTDEVKRALDPFRSFHLQLVEEVEGYERLKRGDLGELSNLHGLGRSLVALRIALGLTQRELAARLGVHESQVSRDERNEYPRCTGRTPHEPVPGAADATVEGHGGRWASPRLRLWRERDAFRAAEPPCR
jgi:hypothetical protein